MANKFVIKNGLLVGGRVDVTGSINLSQGISSLGGFTGSLVGTASYATYALNATIDTGSFVQNSSTASFVTNSQTGSFARTNVSNTFTAAQTFNGNVTINATASIAYLNVQYESASVIYSSGSNQIGDDTSDIQTIIGTTKVSGSLQVTGSIFGALFGTASWATNAISANSATSATNATNVVATDAAGSASTYYVAFLQGTSGNQAVNADSSNLKYVPSTNTLTVTNLVGTASYIAGANVDGAVNDSNRLGGQGASYYLNASNINAGTLNNSYLPSAINVTSVTASFKGDLVGTSSWANNVTTNAITDLATGIATFLNSPSSANLASAVTDETGTGALVFANTPTLTTPKIGAATGTSLTVTGQVSGSVIAVGGQSKTYSGFVNVSQSTTVDIISIDTATDPCFGIHIRYVMYNTNGTPYAHMRSGTLMVVSNVAGGSNQVNIAESTTQDIGDTSLADFTAIISGATNIAVQLTSSGTEDYRVVFDYTLLNG